MAYWYVNYGNGVSTGYYAVPVWATGAKIVGQFCRQLAVPTVNNERCFVCIVAGTSGGAEATWNLAQGNLTTDNTVTWLECTGKPGTCGSLTNTPGWSTGLGAVARGTLIKGTSNATTTLFICSPAGTVGAVEPTWNTALGALTMDNTATWTSLGPASNYSAFQNPHARLATVLNTFRVAGDTQFVADNHAETQAAAMTFLTSTSTPNQTYCVDHTVATPTAANLKTGASVATTGANILALNCNCYFYGITFSGASGAVATTLQLLNNSPGNLVLDTCILISGGTAVGGINIGSGTTGGVFELINTSIQFSSSSARFNIIGSTLRWRYSTAFTGAGVKPLILFTNSGIGIVELTGINFTGFTGSIFSNAGGGSRAQIKNCKFDHATTPVVTPTVQADWLVDILQSDSDNKYYRHERWRSQGLLVVTTTNTKQGGANDGVTSIAWVIDTFALVTWYQPFESIPIVIWNTKIGVSVSATINIMYDAALTPSLTNKDVWIEVEYMGTSGSPLGAFVSSGLANVLSTPVTLPADVTSVWNTAGLTTPTLCNLTVSFTPQNIGFIKAVVKCSNPSAVIYVGPKMVLG